SRHSAAISLFDRLFVKTTALPRDLSRWLHEAFALRQQADYAPEPRVTVEQARATAEHAQEFVDRVQRLLSDRGHRMPGLESE
ncbi:MAG TPA: DNA-binding protein, partial [Rhodothermales bacterium]